jgi:hypothetical protein
MLLSSLPPRLEGRKVTAMDRLEGRRGSLFLVVCALLVAIGGSVVLARALAGPDGAGPRTTDPQAGLRVQSAVAQLMLREAGLSSRQEPVTLSDTEVNAFLAGHVEIRDPPVWPVRVQLHPDGVELGGATTVGRLVEAGLGRGPASVLPGPLGAYPVWVAARGQITVSPSGRAEFLAHTGMIGRQRVPVGVLWRGLGGRPPALVWHMPRVVERVDVEPGRLLIYTRRLGARGSPG